MDRGSEITLDDDGQPANLGFNWHRNLLKGIEALLGICRGLTADCDLNEREILFLDTWLKDNAEAAQCWPGEVIATHVATILADGIVTRAEAAELCGVLDEIVGSGLEHGITAGQSTELPLDRGCIIEISDRSFCFTGKFIFGSRARCQRAVLERGGSIEDGVTHKLDYLVVGALASRDWCNSPFGRKILKAVSDRERGKSESKLVGEEDWARALGARPKQPLIV